MTLYFIHPNGEIVTDASGRQDKALVGTLENYYYPYRYMALADQNPTYAGMCKLIERTAGVKISGYLDYYLTDKSLWKALPEAGTLPVNYIKSFPNSGIVRIRRKGHDSTLIAKNPVWLTFMKGQAVIQGIRFSASFFGKGQFQSDELVKTELGWELVQRLEGPYYQPLSKEQIAADGDWNKMPRTARKQSEVQHLEIKIIVREIETGLEVEIKTNGTTRVPVALEIIFREGGTFNGLSGVDKETNTWLLKDNFGSYTFGDDTIHFGPGLALHKNVKLRGALPAMNAPTVFLTGFTPFNHILKIS